MIIDNLPCFEHSFCNYIQTNNSGQQIYKDFCSLKSHQQQLYFVLKLFDRIVKPAFGPNRNIKSSSDSKDWLTKARSSLTEEDKGQCHRQQALLQCTKALMCAPLLPDGKSGSPEFVAALDLRSEILLQLSMYDSSLADIECLLSFDLPSEELTVILERKGKCYEKQEKYAEAITAYEEAAKVCKILRKDASGLRYLIGCAKSGLRRASKGTRSKPKPAKLPKGYLHQCEAVVVPTIDEPHFMCPTMSSAIHKDHFDGDKITANRNIKPGEVVIIEDPFVTCYSDPLVDICTGCNKICWPLPTIVCHQCTKVLFCSEECRLENAPKSHNIECPILDWFTNDGNGRNIIYDVTVLRTIITTGLDNLYRLYKCVIEDPEGDWFSANNVDDYSYNAFVSIFKQKSRDNEDWAYYRLGKSIRAHLMTKLLEERTTFFNDTESCRISQMHAVAKEDFIFFIACAIYKQLVNMPFSSLHIQEMIFDPIPSVLPLQNERDRRNWKCKHMEVYYNTVAIGLYPGIGSLEHCCQPNTAVTFFGTKAIVRSCRTVYKGETVTLKRFAVDNTSGAWNKIIVDRYLNSCKCVSCIEAWSIVRDGCDMSQLCTFSMSELVQSVHLKDRSDAWEFYQNLQEFSDYLAVKSAHPYYPCTCAEYMKKNADLIELFDRYTKKPNVFQAIAEIWYKNNMHYQGNHSCCTALDFESLSRMKSVAAVRIDLTGPSRIVNPIDLRLRNGKAEGGGAAFEGFVL